MDPPPAPAPAAAGAPQRQRAPHSHPLVALVLVPFLAATYFLLPRSAPQPLNVLPLPAEYTLGKTVACLAPTFSVVFTYSLPDGLEVPSDLARAAERMRQRLIVSEHTYLSPTHGAEYICAPGNEITELRLAFSDPASIAQHATVAIEERAAKEAYELNVPAKGSATATAETALGLLRAMSTFEALFFKSPDNTLTYAPFTPYAIKDKPAFAWRAVLLDTSRHFFAKASILKMLDTMAAVKLNVFHWHITDSNSWPLDLQKFPDLAAKGAYRGRKYSEADVQEVVAYAAERGIDVVLEIDTPGHTAIIGESRPDLIACRDHKPWTGYANQPPAGQLRFADSAVSAFTAELLAAAAALTRSKYFSSGGDEINMRCMAEDRPTQALLKARGQNLQQALAQFTNETHQVLVDSGRTPVVWEDLLLEHGVPLHRDTVVEIWSSSDKVRPVLDKGYRIVHAAADHFYLDCGQGGWITQADGKGNSWCDPFKSWAHQYSFDPFAGVDAAQRALVLGGQTSLWAEQTDESNLESTMWPRAAASAELWWTGGPFPREPLAALARMHDVRYRLVDRGVRAAPLQPEWCALRPGVCVLNG